MSDICRFSGKFDNKNYDFYLPYDVFYKKILEFERVHYGKVEFELFYTGCLCDMHSPKETYKFLIHGKEGVL